MKKTTLKKILAYFLSIISNIFTMIVLMQLFNVIRVSMLQAGYREGGGISQFIRVFTGIPLLMILAAAWIAFFIYSFYYYEKGVEKKSLINRFLFITGLQMILVPLIIIIYQIVFPLERQLSDLLLILASISLSAALIFISKKINISF